MSEVAEHGLSDPWLERRQGDILDLSELPFVTADGWSTLNCPLGVAIISQTCDIVLENRPNIAVAPVVDLDGAEAVAALTGVKPRYVAAPNVSTSAFVDLKYIAVLNKYYARNLNVLGTVVDQEDFVGARLFALQIGRRFSRFPFPDEVAPWFSGLQSLAYKRHDSSTPVGKLLRDISEFRVQSHGGWDAGPVELTLFVITKPGVLPDLTGDELAPATLPIRNWLKSGDRVVRTLGEVAERLYPPSGVHALSADEVSLLWQAAADLLAAKCRLTGALKENPAYSEAVVSITAELTSETEFTLADIRTSEILDLEHLSQPSEYQGS